MLHVPEIFSEFLHLKAGTDSISQMRAAEHLRPTIQHFKHVFWQVDNVEENSAQWLVGPPFHQSPDHFSSLFG